MRTLPITSCYQIILLFKGQFPIAKHTLISSFLKKKRFHRILERKKQEHEELLPSDSPLDPRGHRSCGKLRFPRGGAGDGGEAVGVVREVAEPPHGVEERGREAQAVQRVQGQRTLRQRLQQEGQAIQAEAQQVCRHDQPRVPEHLRRFQVGPPPYVPWPATRERDVHVRGCSGRPDLH